MRLCQSACVWIFDAFHLTAAGRLRRREARWVEFESRGASGTVRISQFWRAEETRLRLACFSFFDGAGMSGMSLVYRSGQMLNTHTHTINQTREQFMDQNLAIPMLD